MDLSDIDLTNPGAFVDHVPHEWFAQLRADAPVYWHEEADGPGFWAVTKYDDCVAVNRDYEHFSSAARTSRRCSKTILSGAGSGTHSGTSTRL